MAPEVIRHQAYSEKIDVWSYGVVLWELLLFEAPYMDCFEKTKLIFGVGSGNLQLHVPSTIPNGLKLLLQQCLNNKPRNRPLFSQIIKHLDVSYENDAAILKNDALYLKLQSDDWKSTVKAHYESMTKKIEYDQQQHQKTEYDLIQRREEELQHATNIREFYEARLQKANNLYFELNAVLLQLEQREEAVAKKEEALNIKNGNNHRMARSLIKREFQQKAKIYSNKVLDKLNKFGNNQKKPIVEQVKPVSGNDNKKNEILLHMEPIVQSSIQRANSTSSLDKKTSYEIPMSYEQVVEAEKKTEQRKYVKRTTRRYKKQKDDQKIIRRTTTLRLYNRHNDNDDYGFHADTEEDDKRPPSYYKLSSKIKATIIDEQHRRKHNSSGHSNSLTDYDEYDIDNDNIEDIITKKNVRPASTDYFDDEVKKTNDSIQTTVIAAQNNDENCDTGRYDYEYDQKIEILEDLYLETERTKI